jgi:phage terminase large subunit-like protein
LSPELLAQAVVKGSGPLLAPERGWAYVAAVDLGLSRDAAALVVLGLHVGCYDETETLENQQDRIDEEALARLQLGVGTGKCKLARCLIWHPPGHGGKIAIEPIEAAILDANALFGLQLVAADPWQAAYLVERLRKAELPVEEVVFQGPNLKSMASAVVETFNERRIELYDCPQLMADLQALRLEEKTYGVRLVSPRGPNGHGDAATALSIALHVVKRYVLTGTPLRINGPLLVFP